MKSFFPLISIALFSKLLSVLLIFGLSTSSYVRCWIGIVDQINPPWLVISKESNEQVEIPLAEGVDLIKEGDWVIYWTQQKRLNDFIAYESLGTGLTLEGTRGLTKDTLP